MCGNVAIECDGRGLVGFFPMAALMLPLAISCRRLPSSKLPCIDGIRTRILIVS